MFRDEMRSDSLIAKRQAKENVGGHHKDRPVVNRPAGLIKSSEPNDQFYKTHRKYLNNPGDQTRLYGHQHVKHGLHRQLPAGFHKHWKDTEYVEGRTGSFFVHSLNHRQHHDVMGQGGPSARRVSAEALRGPALGAKVPNRNPIVPGLDFSPPERTTQKMQKRQIDSRMQQKMCDDSANNGGASTKSGSSASGKSRSTSNAASVARSSNGSNAARGSASSSSSKMSSRNESSYVGMQNLNRLNRGGMQRVVDDDFRALDGDMCGENAASQRRSRSSGAYGPPSFHPPEQTAASLLASHKKSNQVYRKQFRGQKMPDSVFRHVYEFDYYDKRRCKKDKTDNMSLTLNKPLTQQMVGHSWCGAGSFSRTRGDPCTYADTPVTPYEIQNYGWRNTDGPKLFKMVPEHMKLWHPRTTGRKLEEDIDAFRPPEKSYTREANYRPNRPCYSYKEMISRSEDLDQFKRSQSTLGPAIPTKLTSEQKPQLQRANQERFHLKTSTEGKPSSVVRGVSEAVRNRNDVPSWEFKDTRPDRAGDLKKDIYDNNGNAEFYNVGNALYL